MHVHVNAGKLPRQAIETWMATNNVTNAVCPQRLLHGLYHCGVTQRRHPILLLHSLFDAPHGLRETSLEVQPAAYKACYHRHTFEYALGTKHYTLPTLTLDVMDHFDFFVKLDVDVRLLAHVDINKEMTTRGAYWLQGTDDGVASEICQATLNVCLQAFVQSHGTRCSRQPPSYLLKPRIRSFNSPFVAAWLGTLQAPLVLQYAQLWWTWPGGWDHRWGDQEFWMHALWLAQVNHTRVANVSHEWWLTKGGNRFQHY